VTDSEYPDSFAGLFGELDADSPSSLAQPSPLAENTESPAVESAEAPGFASRREMRQAGGYRAVEAAPASRAVATRTRPAKKRTRTRDVVRADLVRPAKTSLRRKLSSAGVMTVVVGLFASLTLPAFADQNALAENQAPLDGQALEITAATTDESALIRDAYGTTSAADLRKLYADAIRQQNLQAYLASGARELGDDYPWPDMLSRPQGGGLSPLNYYYRECVDFVAWRLNRDAGSTSAPFRWVWSNLAQGSAYSWKRAWESHGWPTGSTPQVGAVAWAPGGNHVAYVSGILGDGSVVVEEYNYAVDHGYSQRIAPAGSFYYLYAPPS
jgi:surface antigen